MYIYRWIDIRDRFTGRIPSWMSKTCLPKIDMVQHLYKPNQNSFKKKRIGLVDHHDSSIFPMNIAIFFRHFSATSPDFSEDQPWQPWQVAVAAWGATSGPLALHPAASAG